MKQLTNDELGYLKIAYKQGFHWVVTDKNLSTWFLQFKPTKWKESWSTYGNMARSLVDFGTSWEDEEPTEIIDLLDIDNTKHRAVSASVCVVGYYQNTYYNCTEEEARDMLVDEVLDKTDGLLTDVTTCDEEVFIRD